MKPGDPIPGINIYTEGKDPILKEKTEYPDWLWDLYNTPRRHHKKLTLIAEMTNSTGNAKYMAPYPPYWEFTTLDNVQILDKNAKRAYTRRVIRLNAKKFTDQMKAGVFQRKLR